MSALRVRLDVPQRPGYTKREKGLSPYWVSLVPVEPLSTIPYLTSAQCCFPTVTLSPAPQFQHKRWATATGKESMSAPFHERTLGTGKGEKY